MVSEAKVKGKERVKRKQTESKAKGKPSETQKTAKLKAASKDKALKASTASSNWLALQKKLPPASTSSSSTREREHKRRKLDHVVNNDLSSVVLPETEFPRYQREQQVQVKPKANQHQVVEDKEDRKNGESLASLRRMVLGEVEYDLKDGSTHIQPGKYLALDCEMVGIGIDGSESSLARVTLVNYHGYPILDSFVLQKERVVDYRTRWSGVREGDLTRGKAKSFEEVQAQVAELIKDRILVGHAVYNDLKALLLPHPRPLIRDTQHLAYAGKPKITKSKYISLRNLVLQELDLGIQDGEHSSLTDARATMAVFRLWRRMWEASSALAPVPKVSTPTIQEEGRADEDKDLQRSTKSKRKASLEPIGDGERGNEVKVVTSKESTSTSKLRQSSGKSRKGISSGLSTIVTVRDRKSSAHGRTGRGLVKGVGREGGDGTKWWKEL